LYSLITTTFGVLFAASNGRAVGSVPVWQSKHPLAKLPPHTGDPVLWHTVFVHTPSSTCVAPALFQFTPEAVFTVSTYRLLAPFIHMSTTKFWCIPLGLAPPPPVAVYGELPRAFVTL
jgi:hypothetical protein